MESTLVATPAPAATEPRAGARTILFVMEHAGLTRNYEPTLRLLHDRGHRIRVGYVDPRARKGEMIFAEWLTRDCPGITVEQAPNPAKKKEGWPAAARLIRLLMDNVRYCDSRFARATTLRDRAHRTLAGWLRRTIGVVGLFGDRGVRAAIRALRRADAAIPLDEATLGLVEEVRPDLLLVSPLVDFGSPLTEYVKAAQSLGIPAGCCVASWDNLTNKGHLRVIPERVFVWNEAQREEAVTLHGIPRDNVVVTGAQLFDHWFTKRPARDYETFCRTTGLDPSRPFVLFLGSTAWIAPNETYFVERWMRAIRSSPDPDVAELGILLRPHPTQAWRYLSMDFSQEHNAAVYPPYKPDLIDYFTEDGKTDFFESLYHASAAVGVNTSAMIEAGIVGTTTCTILDESTAQGQAGTLHFDLLTGTGGGLLRTAPGLEEHTHDLAEVLAAGKDGAGRGFVESFVRPHGLDVPAAPILADAIESAAALEPAPRPTSTLGLRMLRPFVWLITQLVRRLGAYERKRTQRKHRGVRRLTRVWVWATFSVHAKLLGDPEPGKFPGRSLEERTRARSEAILPFRRFWSERRAARGTRAAARAERRAQRGEALRRWSIRAAGRAGRLWARMLIARFRLTALALRPVIRIGRAVRSLR